MLGAGDSDREAVGECEGISEGGAVASAVAVGGALSDRTEDSEIVEVEEPVSDKDGAEVRVAEFDELRAPLPDDVAEMMDVQLSFGEVVTAPDAVAQEDAVVDADGSIVAKGDRLPATVLEDVGVEDLRAEVDAAALVEKIDDRESEGVEVADTEAVLEISEDANVEALAE